MAYENSPITGNCHKPPTQVAEGFSDLNRSIGHLDDLMMELDIKLHPVLRDEDPKGAVADGPVCSLVPLAEELRESQKKVDRLLGRVRSWLARIEI